ncbi:AEBP2 [Lepeophtheirus salmonis]|uniref:AEBP2 n=1 Tax=Lepeophtheirus salmonis TaxID=72036 RepID=A0A7R8HC30_LEPSM|nr:AEBP2 [Lepeophtheirus salmonis]CAF2982031.1 AEBP2 [Lepeophtheirus salmonis]
MINHLISTTDSSRHGDGIDLPSPASSTVESETSDYPRSTPSPRDHDSGIGSLEEFSDSKDTDQGLGDELIDELSSSGKEACINNNNNNESADVLRKVRVALEKLPEGRGPLSSSNCLKSSSLKKRLPHNISISCSNNKCNSEKSEPAKKLKLEITEMGNQGKITEYLSEMKHFTALRKEKLDRVLNLKTEIESSSSLLQTLLSESSVDSSERNLKTTPPDEEKPPPIVVESHQFEVPKAVIRFPSKSVNMIQCRWESCGQELESCGKLIDHLKTRHASLQMKEEVQKYKCLWEGHGGNKPFQCIVDGCKQRFSTQSLLERHVNSHFKSTSLPNPHGNVVRKICETSSSSSSSVYHSASGSSSGSSTPKVVSKVMKKAGRKLKYRKTIFSARLFDLFDIGIMAQLQEKLAAIETNSCCKVDQDRITLSGSVIAKKRDESGKVMFLMRWTPINLLDDEWVDKASVSSYKTIRICSLPESSKYTLSESLFHQNNTPSLRFKRKFNPLRMKETLS